MLEIRNLTYGFQEPNNTQTILFEDFTCHVQSGLVAITGPSGCGKSTLLYIASGLRNTNTGSVTYTINDQKESLTHCNDVFRKQHTGFIFQEHLLIDYLSVLDNILVPVNKIEAEHRERASELCNIFNIGDLLHKSIKKLSGGQKQRVAIVRSLINRPKVIFADEPTAALDKQNKRVVINYLKEYSKINNALVLLVTHDNWIKKQCDYIIDLDEREVGNNEQ